MPAFSQYNESNVLTHQFRTSSWTKPSVIAFALTTAAPTASSTGSTLTEVSNSNAYARQTLNPLDANWTISLVSGSYQITNASAINFPVATGSWGTITHLALVDSATYGAGNMIYFGAFSASQAVASGNQLIIPAGALTISLS